MNKTPLGRLKPVELRQAWTKESEEFTPWLGREENLSLLGDTIGLELELEAEEKNVGPFRADILCKDTATGRWVLIENQLERTDHVHLGQLLTYAAGLKAVIVVWIAQRFTDEHRAALDWLNEITDERFNFFGLEIELWRIGDSDVAPKFNIACQPNDWQKSIGPGTRELSETRQNQLSFWLAYRDYLKGRGETKVSRPQPQNWISHPLGRAGFYLCSVASMFDSVDHVFKPEIRMEMVIDRENSKEYFAILEGKKSEIEKAIGEALTWHNPPDARMRRIYCRRSADIRDQTKWDEQHAWLADKLRCFRDVFGPLIRETELTEIGLAGEESDK